MLLPRHSCSGTAQPCLPTASTNRLQPSILLGRVIWGRGLSEEQAVSMLVNGFCKEVFKELPMEFAVEAQKLLSVSLEGAVG